MLFSEIDSAPGTPHTMYWHRTPSTEACPKEQCRARFIVRDTLLDITKEVKMLFNIAYCHALVTR